MKRNDRSSCNNILPLGIAAFEMILGNALTAAAFGMFIIPHHFASAGVTGVASVLSGHMPLSLSQMVFVINMLFLLLGLIYIGKRFTVKTILSSVLFPVMLQGFSCQGTCPVDSPMLSILIAGILLGTGSGLLIHSGGSSGGFSILSMLLQKKWGIPVAVTLNITDAVIIMVQASRQPVIGTLCGIAVITLSAFVVGQIISRTGPRPVSAPAPLSSHHIYPSGSHNAA